MNEAQDRIEIPRPASTVILTREHAGEVQIYLLRRSTKSRFMPGSYVFPGGTVDRGDRDSEQWKPYVDMNLETLDARLGGGLSPEESLAYAIAAVRETFEEAGVFLARKNEARPEDTQRACERRMNGGLSKGWLRDWVSSEQWILSLSGLARWSHWITPEARSQRYDTRFFMASMPSGQQCMPDASETTEGLWVNPEKGLMGNHRAEIPLSPPALVTLYELMGYCTAKDLVKEKASRPWGDACMPILIRFSDGALILLPWDPRYGRCRGLESKDVNKTPLKVGEPFSRLWYRDGVWRPVAS
jgi:8-oxo-dGTP pyrophosphatase MutT (NUDIX family)